MKLWLLKRTGYPSYDEYGGFVVRAETEDQAWKLATAVVEAELPARSRPAQWDGWTCDELFVEGEPMVVLPDRMSS